MRIQHLNIIIKICHNQYVKKVRIVVVATKERQGPIMKALNELGHEAIWFEFRQGRVYKTPWLKSLVRVRLFRLIKKLAIARINRRLIKLVEKYKPDILIATMAENIRPETLAKIRDKGVITANWFTDLFSRWHIIAQIAGFYDFFFSSDSNIIKKLNEIRILNCRYLPEAVELNKNIDPFVNRENKYNISFIGSYDPKVWQGRETFLNAVKDLGLNVWGPSVWQSSLVKHHWRGEARDEKMFSIYEASKIAVEIPWQDGISAGVGLRPFEVMSRGACLFVYDIRPDMKKIFKEGVHYVGFVNQDEFNQKAKYYLENDRARLKIAEAGYQEVANRHTFVARIKEILKITLGQAS